MVVSSFICSPTIAEIFLNLDMGRRMISFPRPSRQSAVSPGNPNLEMVVTVLRLS